MGSFRQKNPAATRAAGGAGRAPADAPDAPGLVGRRLIPGGGGGVEYLQTEQQALRAPFVPPPSAGCRVADGRVVKDRDAVAVVTV